MPIANICFAKSQICYFSLQILTQEYVAALHIPVNYWWAASFVQIIQTYNRNIIPGGENGKRTNVKFALKEMSWLYVFFIGAYLVQLRALSVHVLPSSRLQQQHLYLHCINRVQLC